MPTDTERPIDPSRFQPLSMTALSEILALTIKKDDDNKIVTFLCLLSAYTETSQFNVSFNAPTSTGKSYISLELAQYFPEADVIDIAYASPQAFFHEYGKYDKERHVYVIDFSRKIIIFIDMPHNELLKRLRPLLSHDKREIRLKITDKASKGGNRTKTVIIKGFPAVVFCTAGLTIDDQESSRFILLSPQIDQEKIREVIHQKVRKETDGVAYAAWLESNAERKLLRKRIEAIKAAKIEDVRIEDADLIEETFLKDRAVLKPRHQRDVGRLIALIKMCVLLNFMFRKREGNVLIATADDIHEGVKIWEGIAESQEHNLPPYTYELFQKVIVPAFQEKNEQERSSFIETPAVGLTRQDIIKKHRKVYGQFIQDWLLRQQVLPMLEAAGLIVQESDPSDKRRVLVFPVLPETERNSE